MLPEKFKFGLQNNSGANASVSVQVRPWRFDAAGALEWGTPETHASASIGDASSVETTEFNNTTNKYLGAHIEISLTGTAVSGNGVLVYLVPNTATGQNLSLASVTDVENSLIIPSEL